MGERLSIVGVMGSGSEPWTARAAPLGRWLAGRGVHLLTGGGGGVMAAVSQAFHETPGRRGLVIGVLPRLEGRSGYPNPWVEVPIVTHLPLSGARGAEPMSRNHVNVLTSDVLVVLPGHAGTASEVELALAYGRPVVAFVTDPGELAGLPGSPPGLTLARDLEAVQRFVDAHLAAAAG